MVSLESDITHTVSVHLGEVLNPEATLYIYLIGRRGETSKVFLRPEEPLEREKTYKFTLALTVDIGRVSKNLSIIMYICYYFILNKLRALKPEIIVAVYACC